VKNIRTIMIHGSAHFHRTRDTGPVEYYWWSNLALQATDLARQRL